MGRDQNDQKLWFSVRNCPCFKARLPWRSTTTWWRWEEWVFLHGKLYLIGKSKWRSTSFHGGSTDENFRLDHHRGMRIPGPEDLILKFWLRDLRVTTSRKKNARIKISTHVIPLRVTLLYFLRWLWTCALVLFCGYVRSNLHSRSARFFNLWLSSLQMSKKCSNLNCPLGSGI